MDLHIFIRRARQSEYANDIVRLVGNSEQTTKQATPRPCPGAAATVATISRILTKSLGRQDGFDLVWKILVLLLYSTRGSSLRKSQIIKDIAKSDNVLDHGQTVRIITSIIDFQNQVGCSANKVPPACVVTFFGCTIFFFTDNVQMRGDCPRVPICRCCCTGGRLSCHIRWKAGQNDQQPQLRTLQRDLSPTPGRSFGKPVGSFFEPQSQQGLLWENASNIAPPSLSHNTQSA